MNYALSRTSADGGPRTALAASTGHRQAAKSYSSGSSWQAKPPVMAVVPRVALMFQNISVLLVVMRF